MKKSIVLTVLAVILNSYISAQSNETDSVQLHEMVQKYCQSINSADSTLASSLWEHGGKVSFINPRGHEIGWDNIKRNIYEFFWTYFSERDLKSVNERYTIYDNTAIVEFYWVYDAVLKANNTPVQTRGRETQVWHNTNNTWRLVHIHYSGMPVTGQSQGL